jgi:hypothetical protein
MLYRTPELDGKVEEGGEGATHLCIVLKVSHALQDP